MAELKLKAVDNGRTMLITDPLLIEKWEAKLNSGNNKTGWIRDDSSGSTSKNRKSKHKAEASEGQSEEANEA